MICFDNVTGMRGKEAEAALELYKKEQVDGKLKHMRADGKELPVQRKRSYAGSERSFATQSVRSSLSTTEMTNQEKEDARKMIESRKKAKESQKENEPPMKKAKSVETKEERLNKIKSVLRDLSSEIGQDLNVTLEMEEEKETTEEIQLQVSEKEIRTLEGSKEKKTASSRSSTSSSSSSSTSTSISTSVRNVPATKSALAIEVPSVEEDVRLVEEVHSVLTPWTHEIDTHLRYLQECQENSIVLNIGGSKFETSRLTMEADPSSVFALMLHPNSKFRACNNMYSFDRDPAHFKIILNYLRNKCCIEKRYLPREHHYLNEIATEAKFYRLYRLKSIVEERLNELCACRLNQ